jgi:hypothetical protein
MSYTKDDINRMNQYRYYLSDRYKYLIISSDRKTSKTDFLIDYTIQFSDTKPNSKILFLVEYERDTHRILERFIKNTKINNNIISHYVKFGKIPNSIQLINGTTIMVSANIPRGHNFDMILIDDAHEFFNGVKIKNDFNAMYNYITNKIIMSVENNYSLKYIPDEFNFFTVDKNSSISGLRNIKINKIKKNIKLTI